MSMNDVGHAGERPELPAPRPCDRHGPGFDAAMMSYVQLSLMHVPAVIVHGNTLTLEEYSHWYTPAHIMGGRSQRLSRARAESAAQDLLSSASRDADQGNGDAESEAPYAPEAPCGG